MTDEKQPRIRFKGFADDWEQRKLGDIVHLNPKSILPDTFEYVDLDSVVGSQIMSYRAVSKKAAPSRAQRVAKNGDVFYQNVRPYQRNNALYKSNLDRTFVFSTGYSQLRPTSRVDSKFLFLSVQVDKFVQGVLRRSTGTSYPAINSSDLATMPLLIPEINEQKLIGSLLSNLEESIAANQRRLEELQQLKKFLMQNMFV